MTIQWSNRYSQGMAWMEQSVMRDLMRVTERPDIISFASGFPAGDLFPVAALETAIDRVLTRYGRKILQYSIPEGYRPLREFIADSLATDGRLSARNVLITNGAQQALDLIGKMLINPGDRILMQFPTYYGAFQAWRAYQARAIGAAVDKQGVDIKQVEASLSAGPKFMYMLPNFQDPTGVTLSAERRAQLLTLAERFGIPLVEDDPHRDLRFEGEPLAPLITQDAQRTAGRALNGGLYNGSVLHVGSVSETLAPGLRLGWMVGPEAVIERAKLIKQVTDYHTSGLIQLVVYEVIGDGFLATQIERLCSAYRARRDAVIAAMQRHFPVEVEWTVPEGGLYLWVTLPPAVDSAVVLENALARKVAFVPGHYFYPENGARNALRLNFAHATLDQIEPGIAQLGAALDEVIATTPIFYEGS